MSSAASPELLVSLGQRGLGRLDVVRVTPGGSATRRESLFDRATLTRWWSTGTAPARVVAGSPRTLVSGVLQLRRPSTAGG